MRTVTWPWSARFLNIENGDLHEGKGKEPTDDQGRSAAHADDSPPSGRSPRADELERQTRLRLIPTHAGLALGRIDVFPIDLRLSLADHPSISPRPLSAVLTVVFARMGLGPRI
jgi:hypothetical protein